MKTKFCLFILLFNAGLTGWVSAQTAYESSKAGDNWFIHAGAGGQILLGDRDDPADLQRRITLSPTFSAGKWLSPSWGIHLKGQGGALHGFENEGLSRQHIRYYNLHVDALWNLANTTGKYSTGKRFNFTPYIGLGFAHRFQLDDPTAIPDAPGVQAGYCDAVNALSVNGGLQIGFRLSNRLSLDFDLGATVLPDYFDGTVQKAKNDATLSATGGLTLHLGKITFDTVEPMDLALIRDLNGKINRLRTENEALASKKIDCPECPPAAPAISTATAIEHVYVPNVVFFRINSSKIDDNQQISIYNTAEYLLDTGKKLKVIGYADRSTGSNFYNLKLSQKRAKTVADELITKYHIPSQNIEVEWKGSDEQPYKENQWNRVVVMIPQ